MFLYTILPEFKRFGCSRSCRISIINSMSVCVVFAIEESHCSCGRMQMRRREPQDLNSRALNPGASTVSGDIPMEASTRQVVSHGGQHHKALA